MYLLKNPDCPRKLCAELESVLDADEVSAPYYMVRHKPYLQACIDEVLRLLPPVSMNLLRHKPPLGKAILGEYISVSACVVHRDPAKFSRA